MATVNQVRPGELRIVSKPTYRQIGPGQWNVTYHLRYSPLDTEAAALADELEQAGTEWGAWAAGVVRRLAGLRE